MKASSKLTRPYIRAMYRKNHLAFLTALAASLTSTPLILAVSWLLGEVLDTVTAGDLGRLVWCLWFALFLALANFLADSVYAWSMSRFIHRAMAQYKDYAFARLSEKGISAFARENTSRYLSALTNDAASIEENYLKSNFGLAAQSLVFLGGLGMMFWYSAVLALAALGLSVLPILASLLMGGELSRRESQVSDGNQRFVSRLKDLLGGFAVIKSFKAEQEAREQFEAANSETEEIKRRRRRWQAMLTAAVGLCGIVMQFGIFLFGAYLAMEGRITGGAVIAIVNLSGNVLNPIQTVPQYWAARKAARGLIEKLARMLEENRSRPGRAIQPALREAIELQDVTFGYEPDRPVLRNVSLRLEAGKKYALVGASGSGKSTLLNLLMGAWGGYGGSVTIDGQELREVSGDSLYDLMSLIGQNVFLFDDTIRRNITMFRDFPDQQVADAVKRSGLTSLVAQKGGDYRCGENGGDLSGGELQRISIARTLLRGAPVLLLDEATASLDNQTAYEVTDAILGLEGLTRLVVTHRLEAALLERYDEIFVLRSGAVAERGRFADLMDRKGYFYSLYNVTNG